VFAVDAGEEERRRLGVVGRRKRQSIQGEGLDQVL
jgi:hypothetical protein